MFNGYFIHAMDLEFRRSFKKPFYSWLYGNAIGKSQYHDFGSMYLMGGEL